MTLKSCDTVCVTKRHRELFQACGLAMEKPHLLPICPKTGGICHLIATEVFYRGHQGNDILVPMLVMRSPSRTPWSPNTALLQQYTRWFTSMPTGWAK